MDLNDQVLESMLMINQTVLGNVPAESQGMVLESASYSLSLLMLNAVSSQHAAAQTTNASIVSTCAEILRTVRTKD